MSLLKKDAPFIWTKHQFELEVDASQYTLGAILWQRDPAMPKKLHAVGYYSGTLSLAKMNYKIHDCELLVVIHTLCHWSHLLQGTPLDRPVKIWIDYKNLTYWSNPVKVGPCAATWQVKLEQYNFELHYKPGEQNKANALS